VTGEWMALVAVAAGRAATVNDTTIVLVPYVKSKTGLPVIAAGGISTGAQMAAALPLVPVPSSWGLV